MSRERKSVVVIAARLVLVSFCALGLYGVAPIAFQQAAGTALCPAIGFIPACYLVFVGYTLVGVSAFVGRKMRIPLFAVGWIPVFALAMTGASLEALGNEVCPRNASNIPTCFLSLGLAIILITAFIIEQIFLPKSRLANERIRR